MLMPSYTMAGKKKKKRTTWIDILDLNVRQINLSDFTAPLF